MQALEKYNKTKTTWKTTKWDTEINGNKKHEENYSEQEINEKGMD